jgi:prepilin-type N-terminal cleavage/methylation domain-containing protein
MKSEIRNPKSEIRRSNGLQGAGAFTLIELLVVIAIISVIAGFTLVVVGSLSRTKNIKIATAELEQIESALDNYKAKYGVYPPGNANLTGTYTSPLTNSLFPQLYYELTGVYTTNKGGTTYFVTLDNSAWIQTAATTPNQVNSAFGVSGFINCTKSGDEESAKAQNFLLGLRANRIGSVNNNGVMVSNLITTVRGPDVKYMPLGVADVNPFRYVYPGVNNPNSYDLWVQLVFGGKTNLVCNWSKTVIINSPLP